MVLPPKPPPMSRAPQKPSMPAAHSCMMSSSRQEFPKLSRLEMCECDMSAPISFMSPLLRAFMPSSTRSFSVTMWLETLRCNADSFAACSLKRLEPTSRRCVMLVSPMASLKVAAAAKQCARSSSYLPSTSWWGAYVFASTKQAPRKGTYSKPRVRQSRKTSDPARPMPELNWSRMPQPMPTKLFSAALAALISARSSSLPTLLGKSRASSLAVDISTAAELETPAPGGTSEVRKTSNPPTSTPSFLSSSTTPMT
mmetsp:Transcript_91696/g.259683  ORF Transcript_91696/g.259683 Transcript_91696/m.259683 type:complete len:255 (-) Transcript_91696:304-1068(-)